MPRVHDRQGDRKGGKPSPWRQDAVRHVLRNARYVGQRVHKGEVVAPAVWEVLVSDETFEAAQAVLADPTRRNPPGSDVALLTGIARCAVCGSPVHGGRTRHKTRTYRCKGAYGHVSRQAGPVDEFVEAVIVARLARPDAADLLTDQDKPGVDVKGLRAERQAIRRRQEALEADYALAKLSRVALERARAASSARLAEIDAALADTGKVDVLGPLVTAADVAAVWEELPIERRRGVVDTLAVVTLHPPGPRPAQLRPRHRGHHLEDVVTETPSDAGWSRTVVRHGGTCGAEVASVYRHGDDLALRGSGVVDGSRVLHDADRDEIPMRCPKCGHPGSFTPSVLIRAACTGRRALALR